MSEPKKTNQKKAPSEQSRKLVKLLGLDFGASGLKAVCLKKGKGQIQVTGVDVLDPVQVSDGVRPALPKSLGAYYTALCASASDAKLRVFAHDGKSADSVADMVRENLSVGEDFRVGGHVLVAGGPKRPQSVLGVAVPEESVEQHLALFAVGAPAPHSFEVSGLAAFNAFMYTRGDQTKTRMVCLIETGHDYTYVAFFHKNVLQVINRFDVGAACLNHKVQEMLGVDEEMADAILVDGSVDISDPVRDALAPFMKQLSIYREYVERQTKSTLSGVYLSGGEARSPHWQAALERVLNLEPEVWSPFEKLDLLDDVLREELQGQEPRFAAAVGAALAGLEAV